MAELLAANQITIAKVLDGEMSAEQLAQLNQASEDASQAKSDVANLEIGGRNLFIETDYENIKTQGSTSTRGWFSVSNIKNLIVDDNSEKVVKTAGNSWDIAQYVNVEAGETYTMSCFARLETERSGAKLKFRPDVLQIYDRNFDKDLTTDYQKFTYTWTCGVGGIERIHIRTRGANDVLYVKKIKFEKGNKATDWTPAPEDVDAGIDNAAKVATNFINYDSTNGLVLGNKESGSWVGYRTQIDNDSFNVLDENGNIIASYGSNEVELGKGNPNAIIKMCDGKAYVKNYIVGSQNTSVFCGQDVTVVGEWEGASESYALFKQGFASIGQSSSYIRFSNETDNNNYIEIQGQNITMRRVTNVGDFNCYMDANFKGSVTIATPLPISSGGTGATTASGARTNLGLNKNIITAKPSANVKRSGTGDSKIAVIKDNSVGDKFTVTSGSVYVGSGISKVLVSAYAKYVCTTGIKNLAIRKNGTSIAEINQNANFSSNSSLSFAITPVLIDVTEGDYFDLYWYGATHDVMYASLTRMTIEAVE